MRKIIKIESPGSSDYDVSVCSVSSDGASQKTNKHKNKQKQNKNELLCTTRCALLQGLFTFKCKQGLFGILEAQLLTLLK